MATGYGCLNAYVQPVSASDASDCPVHLDSYNERRVFSSLRTTLRVLGDHFPGAKFELEKPLFDIETDRSSCLPDFIIRTTRGENSHTFGIEVRGFERVGYLRGKEVTHVRLEELGPICLMNSYEFDRPVSGLTAGRRVTNETCKYVQRI